MEYRIVSSQPYYVLNVYLMSKWKKTAPQCWICYYCFWHLILSSMSILHCIQRNSCKILSDLQFSHSRQHLAAVGKLLIFYLQMCKYLFAKITCVWYKDTSAINSIPSPPMLKSQKKFPYRQLKCKRSVPFWLAPVDKTAQRAKQQLLSFSLAKDWDIFKHCNWKNFVDFYLMRASEKCS